MKPLTECPKDRPVILILKKRDGTILEQECYYHKDEPFHTHHPQTGMDYAYKPIGWLPLEIPTRMSNDGGHNGCKCKHRDA